MNIIKRALFVIIVSAGLSAFAFGTAYADVSDKVTNAVGTFGQAMCHDFMVAGGVTPEEFQRQGKIFVQHGYSVDDYVKIALNSAAAFCPGYTNDVMQFVVAWIKLQQQGAVGITSADIPPGTDKSVVNSTANTI